MKKKRKSRIYSYNKSIGISMLVVIAIILLFAAVQEIPNLPSRGQATGPDYRSIAHYSFENRDVLGEDSRGPHDADCDARRSRICPDYISLNKRDGAADYSSKIAQELRLMLPLTLSGDFTIAFTFMRSGKGTLLWDSMSDGNGIIIHPDGRLLFGQAEPGRTIASSEPVPLNALVHYAVVRASGTMTIYKDGTTDQAQSGFNEPFTFNSIGYGEAHGDFQGIIADIEVFDVALTKDQLRSVAGLPPFPPAFVPENTAAYCSDTIDNDNDNSIDCADAECDAVEVQPGKRCEFGREMSCDDNFDNDADGVSDADCESVDGPNGDLDGDGVSNSLDNCIYVSNADQRDTDGDGIGNPCEGETDDEEFMDDGAEDDSSAANTSATTPSTTPSTGGSSAGGSGSSATSPASGNGGGSSGTSATTPPPSAVCVPVWNCGQWGFCNATLEQARRCTDVTCKTGRQEVRSCS